jgi:hypothetical protein
VTNEHELHSSWKLVRLGDICKTTSGGTPSRAHTEFYGGNIPWVKSGELCDGLINVIEETITEKGLEISSAKLFKKGTLLIALYGATVGKLGILSRDAATNQAVCAIFTDSNLETKYLFWYLRSIRADLIDKGKGGAQPNISQGIIRDIPIPLAPIDQQKLIVAEIEKQFSLLDEAVAALKRIQANLKRYKAAVLKAAVEGKLTELWRKEQPDVEPASELLKRILAERRRKWEEDYIKKYVGAHGYAPKDDLGKKKYKEPLPPDTTNLPELPKGWVWVIFVQLISASKNSIKRGPFGSTVKKAFLCLRDTRYMNNKMQYIAIQSWVIITLTKKNIASVEDIKNIPVALPSIKEQAVIVDKIGSRLSVAEEMEAAIEISLKRAERLRQSILKKAFSGELVES